MGLGLVHHGAEVVWEHQTAHHSAHGEVIEGMAPVSS